MTKIIYDAVNTSSFDQNSQRDIFAITVGNIGANIMGTGIGLVSSGFATGLGPFGMTYFGILGVTYGRLLGREMGLLIGKGLFDLFYIPY